MRGLVFLWIAALANGAVWKSVGPFGGSAEVIAVDPLHPNLIVTATKHGLVYRSTDKGKTWSAAAFPHAGSVTVHALAVSNEQAPTFYLGVGGAPGESGLYQSTDGAATWTSQPAFKGRPIYSISIWKSDPRMIAAGSNDGVYISSDRGSSWQRVSQLALQPITALAIDPVRSDVLYAGTSNLPWKTSDGGRSWTSIHDGMLDDSDVFSFDIDASHPQRVFASACSGVYRSENGGESWSRVSAIPYSSRRTYVIRIHPADPGAVFAGSNAGLWRSLDYGLNWQKISDTKVRSIVFDPDAARTLYLATEDLGPLVSHDLGNTIHPLGAGFVSRNVRSIAGSATSIYTDDGLFLASRRGGGEEWIPLQSADGEPRSFSGVVEISPGILLAYTRAALFRSSDRGSTWTKLPPMPGSSELRILRSVAFDSTAILAATADGLYLSGNLGETWTGVIPRASIDALFTGAASRGRVAARSGSRLLLSRDGARTWSVVEHPFHDGEIYDLDLDSEDVILAATARGLFRWADSARNWSRPEGPIGAATVKCVRFHPHRGVALAVQGSDIHVSTDAGVSWRRIEAQGLESAPLRSIEVSAEAPERIFAITQARGVFVTNLSAIAPRPEAADRK
jgi:photosystem II stability/assembly factor-like uncharacterized protein